MNERSDAICERFCADPTDPVLERHVIELLHSLTWAAARRRASREEFEEIVSELVLTLLDEMPRNQLTSYLDVQRYTERVFSNRLSNLRRGRVRAEYLLRDLFRRAPRPEPEANPSQVVEARELLARLEALDDATRALLDEYYLQGLSHAEIAQRRGITRTYARVLLHRARRKARSYLESLDPPRGL